MKTIIIPTDYSDSAQNAMEYAAALAKHSGANLILFHAFHLPIPVTGVHFLVPDIDEIINEHKAKLEKVCSRVAEEYKISVKCISRPTFVVDELSELVKQYDAGLVVMGMRGNSVDYKIFGSVTTAVIKEANFPVLAIPTEAKFQPIEKILFACENSYLKAEHKLELLTSLAKTFNSKIQVLHVEKFEKIPTTDSTREGKNTAEVEVLLKDLKHEYVYLADDDVVNGIENGVREFGANLLVMVPHELGFWDEVFNRSKTRKAALRTKIPLLSLPNPK